MSINARTGETFGPALMTTTPQAMNLAVDAAHDAFTAWAASTGEQRAQLLEALALALEGDRVPLVELADLETGLGPARLNGELDRTTFQIRRFGDLARAGVPFARVDDPAVAGAPPVGHPDMQRQLWPLGPAAMFSASNFPFAFSVLGGDTASALAAGCPVVVKAHPGHPGLSQRVAGLIAQVLADQGLPEGLISVLQGAGHELGVALVQHPRIAAAAFTGSTRGGLALLAHAQARPQPIPFYGELGAINPVVVLPSVLGEGTAALAQTLAGSITLGCGQFCTNPGVIVVLEDPRTDAFIQALAEALASMQPHGMLTAGMRQAFEAGIAHQREAGAQSLLPATDAASTAAPRPHLAQVQAAQFLAEAALREEVFGPSSLVVRADSLAQIHEVLRAVQGSLTVTLLGVEGGSDDDQALVRTAAAIAGRVLFKGVPTGVAVTAAQQHGGPFPASTAPMTTSVGDAAMERFLRPVCFQDAPAWLREREGRPV